MSGKYDGIINLSYEKSNSRPHMSDRDRAGQFAPFAALSGYGDSIKETSRFTNEKLTVSEEKKTIIDMKLNLAVEYIIKKPTVSIMYFVPDQNKEGGKYITKSGYIASVDVYKKTVSLGDGTVVPVNDIYDITGDIFDCIE